MTVLDTKDMETPVADRPATPSAVPDRRAASGRAASRPVADRPGQNQSGSVAASSLKTPKSQSVTDDALQITFGDPEFAGLDPSAGAPSPAPNSRKQDAGKSGAADDDSAKAGRGLFASFAKDKENRVTDQGAGAAPSKPAPQSGPQSGPKPASQPEPGAPVSARETNEQTPPVKPHAVRNVLSSIDFKALTDTKGWATQPDGQFNPDDRAEPLSAMGLMERVRRFGTDLLNRMPLAKGEHAAPTAESPAEASEAKAAHTAPQNTAPQNTAPQNTAPQNTAAPVSDPKPKTDSDAVPAVSARHENVAPAGTGEKAHVTDHQHTDQKKDARQDNARDTAPAQSRPTPATPRPRQTMRERLLRAEAERLNSIMSDAPADAEDEDDEPDPVGGDHIETILSNIRNDILSGFDAPVDDHLAVDDDNDEDDQQKDNDRRQEEELEDKDQASVDDGALEERGQRPAHASNGHGGEMSDAWADLVRASDQDAFDGAVAAPLPALTASHRTCGFGFAPAASSGPLFCASAASDRERRRAVLRFMAASLASRHGAHSGSEKTRTS